MTKRLSIALLVTLAVVLPAVIWAAPSSSDEVDETGHGLTTEVGLNDFKKDAPRNYVDGEVLVRYRKKRVDLSKPSGRTAADNFRRDRSLRKKSELRGQNAQLFKFNDGQTVEEKISELKNDPNVELAQPNYLYEPSSVVGNDPYVSQLWGLDNVGQRVNLFVGNSGEDISAPEAWSVNEGTNGQAVVAVIDTGVAYNHPDLADNMWNGSNCLDASGAFLGGCQHGYDFESDDNTPLPTGSSHGTEVAGIIAAARNNGLGMAGVAPHAKIMALKTDFTTAELVEAIYFAKQNGAKVINASWGCYAGSWGGTHSVCGSGSNYADVAMTTAIADFAPGLIVTAAGNGDGDADAAGDNHDSGEVRHVYPCDLTADNIICVTATDAQGNLATFSNGYGADFGGQSVDVAAPGTNIMSTVDYQTYGEDFTVAEPPAMPMGWSATGDFGTADTSDAFWGRVLRTDVNHVPYAPSANSTAVSPAYDLSGASGGALDLWVGCDTEQNVNWSDYLSLGLSANGSSFVEVTRFDELHLADLISQPHDPAGPADATGYAFHHYVWSLPRQYLTASFKLRFRWITDADADAGAGCWVKNIKVSRYKYTDGSDERYDFSEGTSMATPFVSGLAGLLWGFNPNIPGAKVKDIILSTGDSLPALSGKTVTGRRINALRAIEAAAALRSDKYVASFSLPGIVSAEEVVIDEVRHTVTFTTPYGTDLTALAPEVVVSDGATVSPASGVSLDFSTPVTYTVTAEDGSSQAYTVAVTPTPAVASSVVVTPTDGETATGSSLQLSAVVLDQYGAAMSPQPVVAWSSADELVAIVNSSGLATGVRAGGPVTITAAVADLTATAQITVQNAVPTAEPIPDQTIALGSSLLFTVLANDADGDTLTYTLGPTAPIGSAIDGTTGAFTWTPSSISDYAFDVLISDGINATLPVHVVIGVRDTTPPVLTILGGNPESLTAGSSYADAGATAVDNVDGDISSSITVHNNVNTEVAGTYTVTYSVTDSAGNAAVAERTVHVLPVLDVTQVAAVQSYASADDTYEHGWKWTLKATVPTEETSLVMRFSDWTSGSNIVAAAGNIRFYSAQSSNAYSSATALAMTAANAYGTDVMMLNDDLDPTTEGRQIEIIVETKIPAGTAPDTAYAANYGIRTSAM